MSNQKIIVLTNENFEQETAKSDMPMLVDFWAQWCGPCRAVAPIMDQLADEFEGKAIIGKVNVDEQNELAGKFRVMSIPTVMLFKGGKMVEKVIGAKSKEEFSELLTKNL